MAPNLDAHQRTELAAFVDALYQLGGYETGASWAEEANYPAPNLSNLRNAKTGIDGYNLLKLIRAVAKRLDERPVDVALAAARNVELDAAPSRLEIARRLEELEGLVLASEALARLAAGNDAGSQQPPDAELEAS